MLLGDAPIKMFPYGGTAKRSTVWNRGRSPSLAGCCLSASERVATVARQNPYLRRTYSHRPNRQAIRLLAHNDEKTNMANLLRG